MSSTPNATLLRQAAEWLVRLDDQPSAQQQAEYRAWLAAAPEHQQAVSALQQSLNPLRELPAAPARAALRSVARQGNSGVRTLKVLAISLALLLPASLLYRQLPAGYLLADLRTSSGQWHTQELPDGSRITLDGASAVDLDFDAQQRTLRLLSGEILLSVAKDPNRPFLVQTAHGSVQALGTRFVVENLQDATRVMMIESSTQVRAHEQSTIVQAGQQLSFTSNGLGTLETVDSAGLEQAMAAHQLVAKEQPLPQVLERLARYHQGLLWFDKQALAALQVTAVLPADDSERALRLLARSFPIDIQQYTPWLTRVVLKKPAG